jgi:hypothetical protein
MRFSNGFGTRFRFCPRYFLFYRHKERYISWAILPGLLYSCSSMIDTKLGSKYKLVSGERKLGQAKWSPILK